MRYADKFSLKNKTIFVAGGSGLIGSEVVKAVAELGAKVISLDLNNKPDAIETFEKFDISDLDSLETNIQALLAKYGRVDGWVNCSYPRTADWAQCTFSKTTLPSLQENISSHLNSSLWSANIIAKAMRAKGTKGSLINFGSIYGCVGQDTSIYEGTEIDLHMIYSAIKGGIDAQTKQMASYYGHFGIRVNCLCPGGIFDHQAEEFVKNYSRKVPLRRMGTPEDIAGAAIFLLTDASNYITGTTFMVDGGWTAI